MIDPGATLARRGRFAALYLVLAWAQLTLFAHVTKDPGETLLFGTDTVAHDAIVQLWAWDALKADGLRLPLWCPSVQGGLPTLGAFLWTPFAPTLWLHAVLPFPVAQRWQFVLALWWAACGSHFLARRAGISRTAAVVCGIGFGLSGHLVTLIHAGHLQKVMAISWLPWAAAGAEAALSAGGRRLGGVALAAAGIGMCFLSGHPQIAYCAAALVAGRAFAAALAPVGVRGAIRAGALALAMVLGGATLGAVQLLPGLEMSRWSNRAGGVSFNEATETSYPPSELPELLFPRFLGDSVRTEANYAGAVLLAEDANGIYFGDWGERIVSDYAGVGIVMLALYALLRRRPDARVLFWSVVAGISLIVALGKYTPLYRVLYDWLPGIRSFRSPGTFMCVAALGLPMLAAMGVERGRPGMRTLAALAALALALCGVIGFPRIAEELGLAGMRPPLAGGPLLYAATRSGLLVALLLAGTAVAMWRDLSRCRVGAALCLAIALDLMLANSAFLYRIPWSSYEAYLAPDEVDAWAAGLEEPRLISEPGKELSLRPVLNGRVAVNGYHPISFKSRNLGYEYEALPGSGAEIVGKHLVANLGRVSIYRIAYPAEPPRIEWIARTANRQECIARPSERETTVVETWCPGWRVWRDGGELPGPTAPESSRRIHAFPSESRWVFKYEPASYRIGLFSTLCALGLLAAIGVSGRGSMTARSPR